jgi:hypothetical protein
MKIPFMYPRKGNRVKVLIFFWIWPGSGTLGAASYMAERDLTGIYGLLDKRGLMNFFYPDLELWGVDFYMFGKGVSVALGFWIKSVH